MVSEELEPRGAGWRLVPRPDLGPLAVRPARSKHWYAPADVDVEVVRSQIAAGSFTIEDGGSVTPQGTFQGSVYGCEIDAWAPVFSSPNSIVGFEDFKLCTNVASTQAQVCMKETKFYGLHGCATRYQIGNGNWTAFSNNFTCQSHIRGWRTQGTNLYTAVNGQSALYGFSSNTATGYNC